jgi:hypothetical protein
MRREACAANWTDWISQKYLPRAEARPEQRVGGRRLRVRVRVCSAFKIATVCMGVRACVRERARACVRACVRVRV